MTVFVDTREKARAIKKILKQFDEDGVNHVSTKLYVGDYMDLDNPRLVIDRKQNLTEVCSNVCQQHARFRNEMIKAQEAGIKLIFLVEHGRGIECLDDVIWWDNPRKHKRVRNQYTHKWQTVETNAMEGQVLYKILNTMERKYNVKFLFCNKNETGKEIIRILSGGKYE